MKFDASRFGGILSRTVLVVFAVELTVMGLFELFWPDVRIWRHMFLDIWLIALFMSALIYWRFVKPLDEQLSAAMRQLDEARRQAERLSQIDSLTGLLNRREFFARFEKEWERAERHGTPLALLILDLDHFKVVNDAHGHQTGDAVLRAVAQLIERESRSIDYVGRYGGEEFCVLMPQTNLADAVQLAERLRELISAEDIVTPKAGVLRVTASLGVAEKTAQTGSLEELVALADSSLYQAKEKGRNRVEAEQCGPRLAEYVARKVSMA